MSKLENSMEDIFDLKPLDEVPQSKSVTVLSAKEPNLKTDLNVAYNETQKNLLNIIDQGSEAMESILQIAKEGQHPRAFEVYSGLLKNVVDANKELLNIQKQMRDMDGVKKETNNTNIDKAIFVGSTAELNKLLKDNG